MGCRTWVTTGQTMEKDGEVRSSSVREGSDQGVVVFHMAILETSASYASMASYAESPKIAQLELFPHYERSHRCSMVIFSKPQDPVLGRVSLVGICIASQDAPLDQSKERSETA